MLELRYRGLRSPHKLKGGVSGCARECAEARGKDFGVIATEKGWNLYVGGNGGATPAHAQLLAGDLDTETLVRYLDRFLMYYIRTADRLQRTAPWLDSLDGGLERVREIVVDDALGLGAELEAAMARHVDTLLRRVAGDPRRPGEAGPLRVVRERARHPGPEHQLHARARPDPARRRPTARSSLGTHDPGGSAMSTLDGSRSAASTHIEVEGGVAALVDGAGGGDLPDARRPRLRDLATTTRSRRRRCWPAGIVGTRGDIPFVASPMHKQAFDLRTGQCLDDAAVRVPTYDVQVRRRRRARRVAG